MSLPDGNAVADGLWLQSLPGSVEPKRTRPAGVPVAVAAVWAAPVVEADEKTPADDRGVDGCSLPPHAETTKAKTTRYLMKATIPGHPNRPVPYMGTAGAHARTRLRSADSGACAARSWSAFSRRRPSSLSSKGTRRTETRDRR